MLTIQPARKPASASWHNRRPRQTKACSTGRKPSPPTGHTCTRKAPKKPRQARNSLPTPSPAPARHESRGAPPKLRPPACPQAAEGPVGQTPQTATFRQGKGRTGNKTSNGFSPARSVSASLRPRFYTTPRYAACRFACKNGKKAPKCESPDKPERKKNRLSKFFYYFCPYIPFLRACMSTRQERKEDREISINQHTTYEKTFTRSSHFPLDRDDNPRR